VIAQAVNLMNFLKGPKQFVIPIYQRTLAKDASALPDFCICALFILRRLKGKWIMGCSELYVREN